MTSSSSSSSIQQQVLVLDTSYFPIDGGYLDRIDKWFSNCFFTCSIGTFFEIPLSVLGTWFGVPVTSLLLQPMIIVVIADYNNNDTNNNYYHYWGGSILFASLTIICFGMYLIYWFTLLYSPTRNSASIFDLLGTKYLIGCVFIVQIVSRILLPSSSKASTSASASLGSYHLCLYLLSQIVALQLKTLAHRKRPGLCDSLQSELKKVRRHFPELTYMNASGYAVFESFPSADAAGAMIFSCALSLAIKNNDDDDDDDNSSAAATSNWVYIFVIITSFGRMYYWAHHLLDVLVGCMIPYLIHELYIGLSSKYSKSLLQSESSESSLFSFLLAPPNEFTLVHVLVCVLIFGPFYKYHSKNKYPLPKKYHIKKGDSNIGPL